MLNPGSAWRDCGLDANYQREHLYLLLGASSRGCGIHKLDVPSDLDSVTDASADASDDASEDASDLSSNSDGDAAEQHIRPLPPPIFIMEYHHRVPLFTIAAFGTKIISMPPKVITDVSRPLVKCGMIQVFDVHTRELSFAPDTDELMFRPIYFPLADKLAILCQDSFKVLVLPGPDSTPDGKDSWSYLPMPPLRRELVTSFGVYPDEKTIFVSVRHDRSYKPATYTLNTAETPSEWQLLCPQQLPFIGKVCFNSQLKAWIGISQQNRCITSCASLDGTTFFDIHIDGLFFHEMLEPVGSTLVFMASIRKFCVVQFVHLLTGPDVELEAPFHLFRLTTFSLDRDMCGELKIDGSIRVQYYEVPNLPLCGLGSPLAFCM